MKYIIVWLLVFIQGCSYYPCPNGTRIIEDNHNHLQKCELLGNVYGESIFAFLGMGVDIAKDHAKNQAYKIGATHVSWSETSSIGFPYARGRAYKCDSQA